MAVCKLKLQAGELHEIGAASDEPQGGLDEGVVLADVVKDGGEHTPQLLEDARGLVSRHASDEVARARLLVGQGAVVRVREDDGPLIVQVGLEVVLTEVGKVVDELLQSVPVALARVGVDATLENTMGTGPPGED